MDYLSSLEWPIIPCLTDVNSSSSFYKMLASTAELKKWNTREYALCPCSHAALGSDREKFCKKAISQEKNRAELRKCKRKLASLGPVGFAAVADLRRLEELLPYIADIHKSRFSATANRALLSRKTDLHKVSEYGSLSQWRQRCYQS